MAHVNIDIRLRPIRLAFLVQPDNPEKLFEVFCINTCLWGGRFNPIIPILQKAQNLLKEEKQNINKYLNFFEPDFIVEAEKGISKGIDFDPYRILQIDSLLKEEGLEIEYYDNLEKHGQSIKGLYAELYEEEFKFLNHFEQRNAVYVKTSNNNLKNFVACNFGSFPQNKELQYFEKDYKLKFHPSTKILSAQALNEIYFSRYFSPLEITTKKLKVDYKQNQETILFVLDFENTKDLIDLWNLRTVYQNVISIPIQWIKELSPCFTKFTRQNYNPKEEKTLEDLEKLSGVKSIPSKVFPIFSNSISQKEKKETEQVYTKCIQSFREKNPKIKWKIEFDWKKSKDFIETNCRPILEANRKKIDIKLNEKNTEIEIDHLFPNSNKSGNIFLWANVVTLKDSNNQIATAFPIDYKKNFINLKIIEEFDDYLEWEFDLEDPSDERIEKNLLSTTEGLVIFSHNKDSSEKWNLIDGATVIKHWLQSNREIETTKLSDAGRTAQQIIQSLGFDGVSDLANEDVIELLYKMSGKNKEKLLKSLDFEEFKKQTDKITQKQASQQIIQSLGSGGVLSLANKDVIELLTKILEEHPKRLHFIEFMKKTDKKINEIESTKTDKDDFLYSPAAQKISDVQKTVQSLGFERICNLASEGIINLLKKISKKPSDKSDFKTFENEVNQKIILTPKQQKHLPEILLKKKVIELGMEIKCDKCNKRSWYSLKRLNYSLVCDFCLKKYQFPVIDPILEKNKSSKWSYRVVGPFALPDYAQGGYAVALSIRFFTDVIGRYNARRGLGAPPSRFFTGKHFLDDQVTWSTSQELTLITGEKREIDFILWSQRSENSKKINPTDIIFGEVKSFSSFSKEDISKMKKLAEIFPDSFLVFATMREADEISSGEKKNIKELIEWRKNKFEKNELQTSVIILTGTELFTKDSLLKSWFKKGGKHEKLAVKVGSGVGKPITLRNLAYWTQYLYLEMHPQNTKKNTSPKQIYF